MTMLRDSIKEAYNTYMSNSTSPDTFFDNLLSIFAKEQIRTTHCNECVDTAQPSTDVRSTQIGGDHYRTMAIQPWDALEAWLTPDELRGYHKGVIIGYIARERRKNGIEDLHKAHHHFDKLLEYIATNDAQLSQATTCEPSIKDCIEALAMRLREDADYAWTWLCNIAVPCIDAGATHEQASRGAAQFMRTLFDVDVTTNERWKQFEQSWKNEAAPKRDNMTLQEAVQALVDGRATSIATLTANCGPLVIKDNELHWKHIDVEKPRRLRLAEALATDWYIYK